MRKNSLLLALGLAILLVGCSTGAVVPTTVKVAVPVECRVEVPERPVFPAETLVGSEDIFTITKTLWADLKARKAYALKLETALVGCTAPLATAPN